MIGLLLLAQVVQADKPPMDWPVSCRELQQVQMDSMASSNVFLPGGANSYRPSELGQRFIAASERLAEAMTTARPDLAHIEMLRKEVDRLQIELATRQVLLRSQCEMAMVRQLPSGKQAEALRRMAPLTRERRQQLRDRPPLAPPPPQPR